MSSTEQSSGSWFRSCSTSCFAVCTGYVKYHRRFLSLPCLLFRLRHGLGPVHEEGGDFFEHLLARVDGAVYAIGGLQPINFASFDRLALAVSAIAEFKPEFIASEDHGNAVKRIAVPGSGLTRCQT